MKTLSELAREAIDVQDACNMPGIALSFHEALVELRKIMPTLSTDGINRHPITKLWSAKIYELANIGVCDFQEYRKAYCWCKDHAKKEEVACQGQ